MSEEKEMNRLRDIITGDEGKSDAELADDYAAAFATGERHGLIEFDRAVANEDYKKARIIASVAPRYLGPGEKITLAGKVRALGDRLPEEKRKEDARQRLSELEREQRSNDLGNAFKRQAEKVRADRLKTPVPPPADWNTPLDIPRGR